MEQFIIKLSLPPSLNLGGSLLLTLTESHS
jgi:hypothetical protein